MPGLARLPRRGQPFPELVDLFAAPGWVGPPTCRADLADGRVTRLPAPATASRGLGEQAMRDHGAGVPGWPENSAMSLARRHLLALGAAGLAAPAFVRHARAADLHRFSLGVASGHPQPDAVVLWTRLTGLDLPTQVSVRWQVAHDEAFSRIAASGIETAEPGSAHSVHAEVAGLAPGRGYFYRFNALGQQSATGRTRTAPAADAPATLHAVVTSCQRYDHGLYAAWRDVAAREPDLVMFLGDYLYEYTSPDGVVRAHDGPLVRTLDQFRARYAQYKSDPLLQAAHAAAPWLLVWDDHEVENDYADENGSTLFGAGLRRLRAAAYQAWWEHQPVPKQVKRQP